MYHHFYFSYGNTNEEKPEWRKRRRTEETTATSRRRKKELNFVTFHVADNFYDVLYDGVTGAFPEVNAPEFAYSLSFTSFARSPVSMYLHSRSTCAYVPMLESISM